ncbi:MAG: hypothetical protein RLZZ241_1308 [Bacteroidota bacterium]|jgi:HSP20 family protein
MFNLTDNGMSLIRKHNSVYPGIWNEVFTPDWFGGTNPPAGSFPAVNIQQSEIGFIVELAVPGQKKEDFSIEVDENVLTVALKKDFEQQEQQNGYTRREFRYANFKRSFTLPETVNEDGITAQYESGILRFSIPKKSEALPRPKRLIEIGA